jgi:PAS domain S-box-containing protein
MKREGQMARTTEAVPQQWIRRLSATTASTRFRSILVIVLLVMVSMTAYEAVKQLLFPHLTLWQSHLMTIFVSAMAAGVSAYFLLKNQARLLAGIRQSETRYRNLVENAVEGIFQTTPEGRFVSVNPALARMYGYESPEQLMAVVNDISHQIYVDPNRRKEFKQLMATQGIVRGFEYQAYRKDGEKIWLSENARRVCDENRAILYYEGTVEDITEHRRLADQLRQATKMEAVGRLAGGVAHDFNNLLMVIQGHTDIIQMRSDAADPACKSVQAIKKAAQTAASLTRQLLAFSRMQMIQPKVLDLNQAVVEMGKMLPRLIREDIELSIKPGASLWRVKVDQGQLEQVILNLAVNARDAMPQGGKLILETRNVELDSNYAASHSASVIPGKYVMLAVTDNGQGMDSQTQEHIFEPFFTTKELGKGTGLGLATVYGVVKQSGGWIWVYSEPAKGTTFKIYLPKVEEPAEAHQPRKSDAGLPRGAETILLVEDQESVRELAREALRAHGYNILEASDGSDALRIVESYQGKIELLLTDVVMPRIGGRELAAQLATRFPQLRVIYMSGYAEYGVKGHGILHENAILLQKPFSMSDLLRQVRQALDAVGATSTP